MAHPGHTADEDVQISSDAPSYGDDDDDAGLSGVAPLFPVNAAQPARGKVARHLPGVRKPPGMGVAVMVRGSGGTILSARRDQFRFVNPGAVFKMAQSLLNVVCGLLILKLGLRTFYWPTTIKQLH